MEKGDKMSNALRKLKRNKARRRMKQAGYVQINKRTKDIKGKAIDKSKFAEHWKEYAG